MSAAGRDVQRPTIHVVLACDANYLMPLSVTICSAAANCDRRRRLVFYVIHNGISAELQARVDRSLEQCGFPDARIEWLFTEFDRISDLAVGAPHLSVTTYARLLIPDLLPVEVAKVLYLDSDLVVTADVAPLWDAEPGPRAVLAVRDLIGWVGAPGGVANHRELGIPAEAKYFNAGVLLMNLTKWREQNISARVFDFARNHGATIRLGDQDGLNAVLFDDWGELPFRWNWQIPWRMYRLGKRAMPWKPDDDRKHIIHFTTAEKPWLPACDVEEKAYFFQYLDTTDWSGWRVPLTREIVGRSARALEDVRARAGIWRRRVFDVAKEHGR